MSYYPAGHDVILFGGYGLLPGAGAATFLRDTWSFVDSRWTELINASSCTATTCPSNRAGAMMTYDPVSSSLILFGGYKTVPNPLGGLPILYTYNDTWQFANDTWTNITSSVGPAPPARYAGVMAYDPSDNYILLFGGNDQDLNSLGDTWSFNGEWSNLTASVGGITGYEAAKAPEPRTFAAIAASPTGSLMVFGGADSFDKAADFDIIQNYCDNGSYYGPGDSSVAWWFYHGAWARMAGWGDTCPPPPPKKPASPEATVTPDASTVLSAPPCGRIETSLGWSPKNDQFALYGGYGSADMGADANCTENVQLLNDTWVYGNVSGGGFVWHNGGDSGDPPAREGMGYASDFTDDYFEIFGGLLASGGYGNSTWRFYEVVHAKLSGPDSWNTGSTVLHLTNPPFVVTGYGGSGDLSYTLRAVGLRTANTLDSGTGCSPITDGETGSLPENGTVSFTCNPDARSFNLYKILLKVTDAKNTTDSATSSWIFEVIPPEAEAIYSEYVSYFYQGVDLSNTFTVFAQVNGEAPDRIIASIGNSALSFTQTSGSPKWWNATVAMSSIAKGAVVHAEALWGNWSLNATYDVSMISFPSWLANVYEQTGSDSSLVTSGHGPFNRTYTLDESYDWNLGDGLGFSIPVELLGGDYDVIPSMTVVFNVSSLGDLSVRASLPLTQPSIDIGPASLGLSISFNLSGTFAVSGSTVTWVSATAEIDIGASLAMSVPIYGFSILGINVGFTLQLQVNVTAALKLILAPTTDAGKDIIPGIGVMIQNFVGSLTFALSAAINFGIGIASVGLGVGVSVALAFVTQPDFSINAGWVNGSIFVEASFLFWSDSWNLASGTIYSWDPASPATPAVAVTPGYDNGTNTTWSPDDRYYNISGVYDSNVWDPLLSSGQAIDDLYPSTEVTGAGAYNGAYLFYTNDNVNLPVRNGLEVSGDRLAGATNTLGAVPPPQDPGYLLFAPHAATLGDGDLYVVWDALPLSEVADTSPLDLSTVELQGALFDPVNSSWGPVRTFSTSGIAESALVDATGGAGYVLELVSSTPLVTGSTPERLVEYSLDTGAVSANVSVSGLSEVVSLRGPSALATVETVGGNYSLVDTATGAAVAIGFTPAAAADLTSASFVAGAPSLLVLLYRENATSQLVLYDAQTDTTLATETLGANVSEAEGITSGGAVYLFVHDGQGVEGWAVSGDTFRNGTAAAIPHLLSYGLVQDGASIVVYAVATNGSKSQPTVSLWLVEVSADLAPAPIPASAAPSPSSPAMPIGYIIYLAVAAGLVALLLAVLALRGRRPQTPRPPPNGAAPASAAEGTTESSGAGPSGGGT